MRGNEVKVTVSAEVNTILSDLYGQIEYELRDDYEDGLEKAMQELERYKKEKDALMNSLFITRNKYNNDKARYRRKAKNYKARIDKAIEYIKIPIVYETNNIEDLEKTNRSRNEELLNILQGKSDE